MVSATYLLRYPVSTISRSLYDPNDQPSLTLAVEQAATSSTVTHPAEVLHAGNVSELKTGQLLTVAQLLTLLLETRKVVTL